MTVRIRDASNFDASVDFAGLAGFTHKATEGTSIVHDRYPSRLTAARTYGVPVLGAYHVVRTPNAANGSLLSQLRFWLGYLDGRTPWWREHPNFMLQIDAERWSYDDVQSGTVQQFAGLLVNSGIPGWKVTYASRGQYGDSLRGIATPLWNADYRGSVNGSYPGDTWVSYHGQPAGWAPYSGQVPVYLQYTSTPYDLSAFRGSLDELVALTRSGGSVDTVVTWNTGWMVQRILEDVDPVVVPPNPGIGAPGFTITNVPKERQVAAADSTAAGLAALQAAIESLVNAGGTTPDTTAAFAHIDEAVASVTTAHHDLAAARSQLASAQAEIQKLRDELAASQAMSGAPTGTAPSGTVPSETVPSEAPPSGTVPSEAPPMREG